MRKVEFTEFGDESVLQIVDRPEPTIGAKDVLVKVAAASLNPGEVSIREGRLEQMYPTTFPCGEGADFAGEVTAVGTEVTSFAVGDQVAGYTEKRASHAEFVAVPESQLNAKPQEVSYEVAGSLYVAGATAVAAVDAVDVQAGDTVVVAGASGAVGLLAAQLAIKRGATVIGIASPNYHEWLQAKSITPVDYHGDVTANLQAVTDHIDALIDTAGDNYVKLAVELGVTPDRINTVIDFAAVGTYNVKADGAMATDGTAAIASLLQMLASGELELPIAKTFPLDDVQAAYKYQSSKHDIGKVVLLP